MALPITNHIKAAVDCGGSVIRMAFQARADFENLLPSKRASAELVQPANHSETHGDTTAKSSTDRNISANSTREGKRLVFGAIEKCFARDTDHRNCRRPRRARDS